MTNIPQVHIQVWHAYTKHTSLTQTLKKAIWNNYHKVAGIAVWSGNNTTTVAASTDIITTTTTTVTITTTTTTIATNSNSNSSSSSSSNSNSTGGVGK